MARAVQRGSTNATEAGATQGVLVEGATDSLSKGGCYETQNSSA